MRGSQCGRLATVSGLAYESQKENDGPNLSLEAA